MTREQALAEANDIAAQAVADVGGINALIWALGLVIGAPDWRQARNAWMIVAAVWRA